MSTKWTDGERVGDLRGQDIIDSRDVLARMEYLESEVETQREDTEKHPDGPDEELTEELAALKALEKEASNAADWRYGETLIADSYFETYARELAEDIGAVKEDVGWPACHIDWTAAAEALQQDYTSVTFGDDTYWILG